MKAQIWYLLGGEPRNAEIDEPLTEAEDLTEWSRLVAVVDVEDQSEKTLDELFERFQGEFWSPNGEARPLIEALGLEHTSMSVGDVIVIENTGWLVASIGFNKFWEVK